MGPGCTKVFGMYLSLILRGTLPPAWGQSTPAIKGNNTPLSSAEPSAASIATVFANRYRQHRWVPWVAYGLAGGVGFSRVPTQAHFPSDVFAGAVLGYTISHYVVLRPRSSFAYEK